MKTMMSLDGTQIVRVSDEEASRLFGEGYRYIAKSIWKEKVRDVETTSDDGYKYIAKSIWKEKVRDVNKKEETKKSKKKESK